MRIGIVPDLRSSAGGIYQYSITVLSALREWSAGGASDQFVLLANEQHPILAEFDLPGWSVSAAQPPSLERTARRLLTRFALEPLAIDVMAKLRGSARRFDVDQVRSRPRDRQWLQGLGIDLMLYPAPQARAFETGLPYVMAIHDLQHRLQPEFPEVSANREWQYREYLFRNGARHALMVLADSEVGKEDILRFYGEYGLTPDRVKVLPFLPASYLPSEVSAQERRRVRDAHRLPGRYFFYPAQFWPHKNHARIVRALGLLKQRGLEPPIVFCGSSAGAIRRDTFNEVARVAQELGVAGQIQNLGYVADQDMGALYAGAAALVMPTFFGPTNIPVLEAWQYGCPVITSDIRGIREQCGEAALLVEPRSVEAIAEGMRRVWTDAALCQKLTQDGRARLGGYTPAQFRARLIGIVEEARAHATR